MDKAVQRLIDSRAIPPTIIVGVWNSPERWAEYAPQRAIERVPRATLERYSPAAPPELKADRYLGMIVEELKPHIDRRFRTVRDSAGTAILGSSMGGVISVYALARYPEVFAMRARCPSTRRSGFPARARPS